MNEEQTPEETTETKDVEKVEEASPLKDVHTLLVDLEQRIEDGSITKDEAIDEIIASLEGMKGEELKGLGGEEKFPLPEEEA